MHNVAATMPAKSRKLILVLAAVAAMIMVVHLGTLIANYGLGHDYMLGLTPLFDVDRERNVPAIFSLCMLVVAAVMLSVIARRQKPGQLPRAALWAGLSAIFVYLTADEGFEIHERIGAVVADVITTGDLAYYAWLIPYGIAGLVLLVVYSRFYRQLDRDTRHQFLIAAVLYVGGAFGTEGLAGIYVHFNHTEQTLSYDLLSALEEALEMAGVIWFIRSLTRYLERKSALTPLQRASRASRRAALPSA